MNKGTIGHTLILVGNVLHGFIFSVLFIENLHSPLGYFYATALLMLIPNIICYIKCKQTTNNTFSNYFIVIGLLLTNGFVGLFYIVGGLLMNQFNNNTREQLRQSRVKL